MGARRNGTILWRHGPFRPRNTQAGKARTYIVDGDFFFASTEAFIAAFDFAEPLEEVVIDVSKAHLWDFTAVGALDEVVLKYRRRCLRRGRPNEASAHMLDRFAVHDKKDGAALAASAH